MQDLMGDDRFMKTQDVIVTAVVGEGINKMV